MATFDFVTDEDLRHSLESDHVELSGCHRAAAWKAVHVLAGSIIEAILIDYLVSSGKVAAASATAKDLSELIELCRTHNILSKKAIELSTIVRSYRNLIHPGRLLRLSERVDEHGATIALAVVEIVVEEVSRKKKETYGYTAEQVVRKVRDDPSALSIAEHIIRETNVNELKRLLLKILPDAYLECCERTFVDYDSALVQRLRKLFRLALKAADAELQRIVGARYVAVLKEEPESVVKNYEVGLFKATDLRFIDVKHHPLVIAHLLGTIKENLNQDVSEAALGISEFLDSESCKDYVRTLASMVGRVKPEAMYGHPSVNLLSAEFTHTSAEKSTQLKAAVAAVREDCKWKPCMENVLAVMEDCLTPF